MPARLIITNLPSTGGKPVVQEQRYEWFFDATKCTKVLPTGVQYRNAGGAMVSIPAMFNGDTSTVVASFMGASHQQLVATFGSPIDWVELTARAESRVPPCGMSYAGAALSANIVPDYTSTRIVTKQWKVQRGVGVLNLGTSAGAGAFRFHEVTGYLENP